MTKNIILLLAVIVLSFPLWVGVDALQGSIEDHIYEKKLVSDPPIVVDEPGGPELTAHVADYIEVEPFEYPKYPELSEYQIQAKSAIVVEVDMAAGQLEVIFQHNINERLPIASLTKLMTAVVASEFYKDTEQIEVSQKAVSQLAKTGYLRAGEILLPEELLHIMLIESSNDAAYAATALTGNNGFVGLMNLKIKDFGMDDTYFYNTHGLDPMDIGMSEEETNYSTVWDLTKLAQSLLKEFPQILEISSKLSYELYLESGGFHHTLHNTNELFYELGDKIVGSKTGLTDKARGCLFLILEGETMGSYYINVLLNSPDRFLDMRKLISFINN